MSSTRMSGRMFKIDDKLLSEVMSRVVVSIAFGSIDSKYNLVL